MYKSAHEAVQLTRQRHSEPIGKLADNHYFMADIVGQSAGFDFNAHAAALTGPPVEVAGATRRYKVLLGEQPPAGMITTDRSVHACGGVAARVDAAHLPFRDGSVGMLFGSYLPILSTDYQTGKAIDLRGAFIAEAGRTLQENGLLVMQSCGDLAIRQAADNGMTPLRLLQEQGSLPLTGEFEDWSGIFINNTDPSLQFTGEALGIPDA